MVSASRMSQAAREQNTYISNLFNIMKSIRGPLHLKSLIDSLLARNENSPSLHNLPRFLYAIEELKPHVGKDITPSQYNDVINEVFNRLDLSNINNKEQLLAKYPEIGRAINSGQESIFPKKILDLYQGINPEPEAPAPVQTPTPVQAPAPTLPSTPAPVPAPAPTSRVGLASPVPAPRHAPLGDNTPILARPPSTVAPSVSSRDEPIRPYSARGSENLVSPLTRAWLESNNSSSSNRSSARSAPSVSSESARGSIRARREVTPMPGSRRDSSRDNSRINRDLLDNELASNTSGDSNSKATRPISPERLYAYSPQAFEDFKKQYPGQPEEYYNDVRRYLQSPSTKRREMYDANPSRYELVHRHFPIHEDGTFDSARFKPFQAAHELAPLTEPLPNPRSRSRERRVNVEERDIPQSPAAAMPAPVRDPSPSTRLERPEGFYPGQRSNSKFPIKLSSPETLYRVEKNAQELENIIPYLPMMTPSQKNEVFNSARELWEIFNNVGNADTLDNVTRRKFATGLESLKHFERALKSASVAPSSTVTKDDLRRYNSFNPTEESQIKLKEVLDTPFQHEKINLLPKKIRTRVENPDGTVSYEDIEESNDDLLRRHALTSGLTALQNESEEPLVGSSVLQPSPEQKFIQNQILDELERREEYSPLEKEFKKNLQGNVADAPSLGRLNQGTEDIPWVNESLNYNTKETHDLRKPVSEEEIARYDLSNQVDGWLSNLRKKAERKFNENEERYAREADARIGQFANRGSWNSGSRIAMQEEFRKERERRRRDFETDMNELESRSMLDSKKNALNTAMNARKMGQEFFLNQMNARLGKDKDTKARQLQGASLGHGMRQENLRAEQNRNVAQMELERDLANRRMQAREFKSNLANQDQELKRRGMIAQISDIDQARTAPFRNAQRLQGLINGATPTNHPIFNPSLSAPIPNVPAPLMARTSELKADQPPAPNPMMQALGLAASGIGSYLGAK